MSAGGLQKRTLIWVPIVHSQADLGSMSDSVRQLHIEKRGAQEWERHLQTVESMWGEIRQAIVRLELDYTTGVRLYQDGLPDCGKEESIVNDLAHAGSRNHALLLELIKNGARLTGTESPELLLEEYELARQALTVGRGGKLTRSQQDLGKRLLERRDAYIAERVNRTLEPGATGLMFLGMLHSLEGRLAPDIELRRLKTTDA